MEISGTFIQRLCDLGRIRNLKKLAYLEPQRQHRNNLTIKQELYGSTVDSTSSLGLVSLLPQYQTHVHLAAQAALSYWQSNKSSIGITLSYKQLNKSTAATKAASLKALVSAC